MLYPSSQVLNVFGIFFNSITPNAEIRRRSGEDETSLFRQRRQGRPRVIRGVRGISDIKVMNNSDVVVLLLG